MARPPAPPNGSPYSTDLTDDELVAKLRDDLQALEASELVGPETAARCPRYSIQGSRGDEG